MWARQHHERWNEEVEKAKKAGKKNASLKKPEDDNQIVGTVGMMDVKLLMMQKVMTKIKVNNSMEKEEFLLNVCKNTEFNQFL